MCRRCNRRCRVTSAQCASAPHPVGDHLQLPRQRRILLYHDQRPIQCQRPVVILRKVEGAAERQLRRTSDGEIRARANTGGHDAYAVSIQELVAVARRDVLLAHRLLKTHVVRRADAHARVGQTWVRRAVGERQYAAGVRH